MSALDPSNHPLGQSFQRLASFNRYLTICLGEQTGAGWYAPEALLDPDAPLLSTLIATVQERFQTKAPNIVGSALFQSYQWPLIAAGVACYLIERRLPDLSVTNVQLRLSEAGDAVGIAFRGGHFAALADDPAAHHPHATLLPDRAVLRACLRVGLETHLGWVIERLGERVGCRSVGLWLAAADRCVSTLLWLMQAQNPTVGFAAVETEINGICRVPGSPLATDKAGLLPIVHQEQTHLFLDRATCCYWYKTEGGDYCSTCPHLTRDERQERLRGYVAGQQAVG